MSVVERLQEETIYELTPEELQLEVADHVQSIAERFFDVIDEVDGCADAPVMVAYFMDNEATGTHDPVKDSLVKGVQDLCAHPDSNCTLSEDASFIDGKRTILSSDVSKNQLVEVRQGAGGQEFASVFWIKQPKQNLPF